MQLLLEAVAEVLLEAARAAYQTPQVLLEEARTVVLTTQAAQVQHVIVSEAGALHPSGMRPVGGRVFTHVGVEAEVATTMAMVAVHLKAAKEGRLGLAPVYCRLFIRLEEDQIRAVRFRWAVLHMRHCHLR